MPKSLQASFTLDSCSAIIHTAHIGAEQTYVKSHVIATKKIQFVSEYLTLLSVCGKRNICFNCPASS